ncbi:MAG TPA: S8 family serine peptidase [Rubrobacter sp.]|nr:S8 family serine peptidase [Rubrobacter sp.]
MGARASAQHLAITLALFLALPFLALLGADSDARASSMERDFVPGQIIVKLASGVQIGQINASYDLRVDERFLNRKRTNIFLLHITDGSSVENKLTEIGDDPLPLVEYAEPNFFAEAPEAGARHRAFPADDAKPTSQSYSKGSSYPDSALNLSVARTISKGRGSTVAVLDTGAQLDHPALRASFEGVARRDFVGDDKDPSEPRLAQTKERRKHEVVGHGTHVAGIVHLVAPEAKIMPLRVLNRKGNGNVFHIAEATSFADIKGADVINLSLGTPSRSRLLREKVEEAIDDGAVVAAAAGNLSTTSPDPPKPIYPAAGDGTAMPDDGLLAVTSVNAEEKRSGFANFGLWVDIAAPGESILSTYPVNRYAYWEGTSMATPFVSGQAALIHVVEGSLDPSGIEEKIRCTARPLSEPLLGAGHADVGASVSEVDGPQCH